ncbi:MAG: pantetheine-phosphate adenylyltransferase [Gemmatimonadetes bacterium]|nr:pantetheine-phosphate adenylyltransferase [Gemmatimonadota bacterium]
MSGTSRVAVFAGSFDPFTRGHEDIVRRALAFADRVIVTVSVNSAKTALFTADEKVRLIQAVMADEPRVEVRTMDGLLVDFARRVGATLLVRGVRGVSDFDYELQMGMMNRHLLPGLEVVFLIPSPAVAFVTATLVREVARLGGDVREFVHPAVADALARKRTA